ncbi:NAC domain-containing protein 2-like [Vitis riparia]|uniref:NAC domain-containing protein 2-like n=1 Tax=Vitis riparia TaxID=96939 RepID=UPI00155ADA0F|nr:NAC domain-containing protein 2-like [Vitis riparia]
MGYRFLPTDEELVVYYLINKAFYRPLPAEVIPDIREREFYSSPPSDLAKKTHWRMEEYRLPIDFYMKNDMKGEGLALGRIRRNKEYDSGF